MRQSKPFISVLILVIIGLHALPVLQKLQDKRQTFWPVLAWGMYKKSRNPGPIRIVVKHITGLTSTSAKERIDAELVGVSSYAFQRLYMEPLWMGNLSAARSLADRLNSGRQDPIVGFRLESETLILTSTGVVTEYNPAIIYQVDN
jgi:hypothetical protein